MDRRRTAAAYFWVSFVVSTLARAGSKPRLRTQEQELDALLAHPRKCQDATRLAVEEMMELAVALHIDWGALAGGNWRYSPRHRLAVFLLCFGNAWPSRKLEVALGWAANAVLSNWRWHIDQIIIHLDAAGSG